MKARPSLSWELLSGRESEHRMSQIQGQMTNKDQWPTVVALEEWNVLGFKPDLALSGCSRSTHEHILYMTWGYLPNLFVFPHPLLQTKAPDSINLPGQL